MTTALRNQIETFAAQFATEVLKALRSASLDDILAETSAPPSSGRTAGVPAKRGPGRPKGSKNGPSDANATGAGSAVSSITSYIGHHPGTSGEAARKALKIERGTWSPAVAKAIAEKKIRKEGERRSTRYWLA